MNIHLTMKRFLLLSFVMSILLAAILSANAQERFLEGAMILAPIGEAGRMTTASDDTLTACFARIPEDVTPAADRGTVPRGRGDEEISITRSERR